MYELYCYGQPRASNFVDMNLTCTTGIICSVLVMVGLGCVVFSRFLRVKSPGM